MAAERAAASAGYVMLIADAADFVGRGEAYHRLLSERRVDGLLVASILVGDEFVKEHGREGLPFVLLNRRARGIALSSSVDDARGVQVAVEHLAALGHKRIGYVAGQTSTEPVRRRLAGFRAGLRTTGLRVHRSLIMESPVDGEGVFRVTQELLSHTLPGQRLSSCGARPRPFRPSRRHGKAGCGCLRICRSSPTTTPRLPATSTRL